MGAFFKGTDSASPDTISKKNLGWEGVLPTPEKKIPPPITAIFAKRLVSWAINLPWGAQLKLVYYATMPLAECKRSLFEP